MAKFAVLLLSVILASQASPVRERRFLKGFGFQKESNVVQPQGPVVVPTAPALPLSPPLPPPPPSAEPPLVVLPASNLSPIMLGASPLEVFPGGFGGPLMSPMPASSSFKLFGGKI